MKFGKLIDYNKRNFYFKNYAENDAGGLVTDLFFMLYMKKKASGLQLSFNIF